MTNEISLETTFNTTKFIGKKPEILHVVKVTQVRHQFFTLFPGYQVEASVAYINGCHYLVHDYLTILYPNLLQRLGFSKSTLYGGMTEFGLNFFIPVYHPKNAKYQEQFQKMNQRVDSALTQWIKLVEEENRTLRYFRSFKELAPPQPQLSLNKMLAAAFPSYRFINSPKHPFISNGRWGATKRQFDYVIE